MDVFYTAAVIKHVLKILYACNATHQEGALSGGFLVQWSIWGRAAEMGRKISLYNDDPLFSAKTGINMGHIFTIFKNWHENKPNFVNLITKFPMFAWKLNNFGK